MKIFLTMIPCFLVTLVFPMVAIGFADTTAANSTYEKVSEASRSNDVRGIIRDLPEIEKLWPSQPEIYIKSVNQAAHVLGGAPNNTLGGAPNNTRAKQALLDLFDNMMQKSIPTNAGQAIVWLKIKCDTISYYLNFEEIRSDKATWLDIAKFIGEIRSKIIPNYQRKGGVLSILGSSKEVQEAIDENERNITDDNLQQTLDIQNRILTFFLLGNCAHYFPAETKNSAFIQKITSSAHLTDDEQRQILFKAKHQYRGQ